jgi:hypothetical protein
MGEEQLNVWLSNIAFEILVRLKKSGMFYCLHDKTSELIDKTYSFCMWNARNNLPPLTFSNRKLREPNNHFKWCYDSILPLSKSVIAALGRKIRFMITEWTVNVSSSVVSILYKCVRCMYEWYWIRYIQSNQGFPPSHLISAWLWRSLNVEIMPRRESNDPSFLLMI